MRGRPLFLSLLLLFTGCASRHPVPVPPGPGNELVSTGLNLPRLPKPGARPRFPRFEAVFREFEKQDRVYPIPRGCVVFIGDDLIARWRDLDEDMRPLHAVNRGFDGASMRDVLAVADWFVIAYEPQMVVVSAGEKDLERGASPRALLGLYRAFVEKVRRRLPRTGIFFLSIPPAPKTEELREKARKAGEMLRAFCRKAGGVHFIDLGPPMLDSRGRVRPILYADGYHLDRRGYLLLKALLQPPLMQGREIYHPYPDARFFGKIERIKWQSLTAEDLEELPLLPFPEGVSPGRRREILDLVEKVGRPGAPAVEVFGAFKRLARIGYEAIPAVIDKIIRLDYTQRDDVVLGALYFDLLKEMCRGVGLEFHGTLDPGSDVPPPWKNRIDIAWNRGAAMQWYRFWVRYGRSRETWREVLLGIPFFRGS